MSTESSGGDEAPPKVYERPWAVFLAGAVTVAIVGVVITVVMEGNEPEGSEAGAGSGPESLPASTNEPPTDESSASPSPVSPTQPPPDLLVVNPEQVGAYTAVVLEDGETGNVAWSVEHTSQSPVTVASDYSRVAHFVTGDAAQPPAVEVTFLPSLDTTTVELPRAVAGRIQWSPSARYLAYVDATELVHIIDTESGSTYEIGDGADVQGGAFSQDSQHFILCDTENDEFRLWSAGGEVSVLDEVGDSSCDASWSPDSRYVMAGGAPEVVFDVEDGTRRPIQGLPEDDIFTGRFDFYAPEVCPGYAPESADGIAEDLGETLMLVDAAAAQASQPPSRPCGASISHDSAWWADLSDGELIAAPVDQPADAAELVHQPDAVVEKYAWLSDNTLLFESDGALYAVDPQTDSAERVGSSPENGGTLEAWHYLREAELTVADYGSAGSVLLDAELQEIGELPQVGEQYPALSPDGAFLYLYGSSAIVNVETLSVVRVAESGHSLVNRNVVLLPADQS